MMRAGTKPLRAVRLSAVVVHASGEGVEALDPMDEADLPQRIQRSIDGLRPSHPHRIEPREYFISRQCLPGRRAQDAEHELLIA